MKLHFVIGNDYGLDANYNKVQYRIDNNRDYFIVLRKDSRDNSPVKQLGEYSEIYDALDVANRDCWELFNDKKSQWCNLFLDIFGRK